MMKKILIYLLLLILAAGCRPIRNRQVDTKKNRLADIRQPVLLKRLV